MVDFVPAYLHLLENSQLTQRIARAYQRLENCDLCPRECGVNRLAGELGICRTGKLARLSSFGAHMGEERPLSGRNGSGTIFFSRCNLKCLYCQNYDISQIDHGSEFTPQQLAEVMLRLQRQGCHNVNFVSPSHVVPQILAAVEIAANQGLCVPLVYNTGGFDAFSTLELLDGVIDIYMPDMKYADAAIAQRYSGVANYPQINQMAVREMHRQVGDLQLNRHGIATKGLLVRHLFLPGGLAGSREVLQFLHHEISPNTYLNLMDQYNPSYHAHKYAELNHRITTQEFHQARRMATELGFTRLD